MIVVPEMFGGENLISVRSDVISVRSDIISGMIRQKLFSRFRQCANLEFLLDKLSEWFILTNNLCMCS